MESFRFQRGKISRLMQELSKWFVKKDPIFCLKLKIALGQFYFAYFMQKNSLKISYWRPRKKPLQSLVAYLPPGLAIRSKKSDTIPFC